jgi:hypothetical protein
VSALSAWRKASEQELELTRRLLTAEFEGVTRLRQQADESLVRTITEYGDSYGSIEFQVGASELGVARLAVEAMALDRDGVPIELLLLDKNSNLFELEVVKADGSSIREMPQPERFQITYVRGDPLPSSKS